ncbi:hypothetical protein [Francisella sp. 19X1-34]|nr:hypothetical protein [Francisella sp. 19X1-34]MED7787758.1 hypothetical protein [Francisella sp. 19X1-34]
MQDIVFLIIKIFFVILAVSVIGMLIAIVLKKSKYKDDDLVIDDKHK